VRSTAVGASRALAIDVTRQGRAPLAQRSVDVLAHRRGPIEPAKVGGQRDQARRILIVEDDDELAELLREYLEQHGFAVSRVKDGRAGATMILSSQPDLVILDLMLPELDGREICRQVRADFRGALLMLTASQSESDHVASLELGADDFMTKPIEPRVLLARVRAQLRRFERHSDENAEQHHDQLEMGPLSLDLVSREVAVDAKRVPLTSLEFDVLWMLAKDAGSVVRREDMYTQLLGTQYDGIDRGMDVHVSRIRRKLQSHGFEGCRLKSVRGVGYLLAYR